MCLRVCVLVCLCVCVLVCLCVCLFGRDGCFVGICFTQGHDMCWLAAVAWIVFLPKKSNARFAVKIVDVGDAEV